jgi:GTP-binding protein
MNGSTLSQTDLESHAQDSIRVETPSGHHDLSSERNVPKIVVVGRPNVGKSTLFNRMVGKRRAITDPMPGVTRDAVRARALIDGHPVELIDTGGYRVDARDIDLLVSGKSLELIGQADLIILMCDVEDFNAEDESFIEHLRPHADRVILVVNKVDNPQREQALWNFHSLGFEHVVGMSATHGIGIDLLEEKIIELLDFDSFSGMEEAPPRIRVAVLGKPNTGKSTLSNRLVGTEASIVSEVPGTTRDVIEGSFSYMGSLYQIMDTAGIRKKKKVNESVEYYSVNRAFKTIEESDVIFLMVDAAEGLTEQDKKIAAQAVKRGRGIILVLNKWDLVEKQPNIQQAVKDRTRFVFPILSFAPLVPISAVTGEGVDKLLNAAYRVWKQLTKRVNTPVINEFIRGLTEKYPPPRDSRGHHKIFYATQVESHPVKFVLFVNRKQGFPKAYVQYIVNNIRKDLGFGEIPISVELRERSGHKR